MHRNTLAAVTIVVLAACGTTPPDAGGSIAGWRKGLVVQVGDRDSLGPPIDSDCRTRSGAGAKTDAAAEATRRYVEVQYFVGRHAHLRIVPIGDAPGVAVGDPIWFRSSGCTEARFTGPGR